MAFSTKNIIFNFQLQNGGNIKISGYACKLTLDIVQSPGTGEASAEIYNIPMKWMEQLSCLAYGNKGTIGNRVDIYAGDTGKEKICFQGWVYRACADFNSAPNIVFRVLFRCGTYGFDNQDEADKVNGATIKEGESIKSHIEKVISNAGLTIADGSDEIPDTVAPKEGITYSGTFRQQLQTLLEEVDMVYSLEASGNKIKLHKVDKVDKEGNAQIGSTGEFSISAKNGLLGYPSFLDNGISFRTYFRPQTMLFEIVNIKSIVPMASGAWHVSKVVHSLSANFVGGGDWETRIDAAYYADDVPDSSNINPNNPGNSASVEHIDNIKSTSTKLSKKYGDEKVAQEIAQKAAALGCPFTINDFKCHHTASAQDYVICVSNNRLPWKQEDRYKSSYGSQMTSREVGLYNLELMLTFAKQVFIVFQERTGNKGTLKINSGFRCRAWNADQGGVNTSSSVSKHCYGLAVDFHASVPGVAASVTYNRLKSICQELGASFVQIGAKCNYCHAQFN